MIGAIWQHSGYGCPPHPDTAGHRYPGLVDQRLPGVYLAFTVLLPLFWIGGLALVGGYDPRLIGVGSDEFRRVINAAVMLTATIAIASYAVKFDTARGYMVIALPCATVFDLVVRYRLRRSLHRKRSRGACILARLLGLHPGDGARARQAPG